MKVVKTEHAYTSRLDATAELVALGDIHRGSRGMEEGLLYDTLDYIVEHKSPVILMGDYGEFIEKKDRRHDYHSIDFDYLSPDKQYRKIASDLKPIKDQVIAVLAGNHEYSYWSHHSIDWANWLAAELDTTYCPDFAYIKYRFARNTGKGTERRTMNILAHHGWTNARTDGYKIKTIHNMKQVFPDCHIYLMGHVHRLGEALPTTHLWVDNRDRIREFNQHYFFTGSYVKNYEPGSDQNGSVPFANYAARKGYAPTSLGSPIIKMKPNRTDSNHAKHKTPFAIKYETLDWLT